MEIQQIKEQLTLAQVLQHYSLKSAWRRSVRGLGAGMRRWQCV